MNKDLESWEFEDPAEVADRRERIANNAEERRRKKAEKELQVRTQRQRLLDAIFKKARR